MLRVGWNRERERKALLVWLPSEKEVGFFLMEKKKEFSTGTWAESQNEIDVIEAQTQMRDYITDMFFPK